MSTERCTRGWQAEALEDGRLGDADAASFQRHLATCDACRREVEALAQLKAVAERLPVLTSTPLEHRRLRQEVLRRAHEAGTAAPRAPKLAWLAAAALALAAAGAFVLWPRPAPEPPIPQAQKHVPRAAPEYVATASPDTIVHTRDAGPVLRLSLERGQLELTVAPLHDGQRFLVHLPDGELEVKGTRFIVQADGTRTTRVQVLEGRVALRLHHHSPSMLQAGDSFSAHAPLPLPVPLPLPISSPSPKPRATTDPEPAPSAPQPTATLFTRAMTAFQAGDFGQADALFEQFEREHPRDSRIEDAVFLRAVSRARRGDEAGARAIARDYLERFPSGLRKPDAERLAR